MTEKEKQRLLRKIGAALKGCDAYHASWALVTVLGEIMGKPGYSVDCCAASCAI